MDSVTLSHINLIAHLVCEPLPILGCASFSGVQEQFRGRLKVLSPVLKSNCFSDHTEILWDGLFFFFIGLV